MKKGKIKKQKNKQTNKQTNKKQKHLKMVKNYMKF